MLRIILAVLFFMLPLSARAELDLSGFGRIPIAHEGRIKPLAVFAQIHLNQFSDGNYSTKAATQWLAGVLFAPEASSALRIFELDDKEWAKTLELPLQKNYSFDQLNAAFVKKRDLVLSLQKNDPDNALLTLYGRVTAFEQIKDVFASDPKRRAQNVYFRVVPLGDDWVTPAQSDGRNLSTAWAAMKNAWEKQDEAAFAKVAETLSKSGFSLEIFYRNAHPYFLSLLFYVLALAAAFLMPQYRLAPPAFVGLGLAAHAIGILCRMIILGRPPVSTLYESILFVGLISTAFLFLQALRHRETVTVKHAAALGAVLQCMGFLFSDGDDSLKILQAVLDTKFWLATHVVIITIGYAFCLLASVAAHVSLITGKTSDRPMGFSIAALALVTFGTVLGGLWADQSWGRFWGWDPKENGALLIILWLTWLLHGRLTKQITPVFLSIGLAALSIIVALSWVGVNLLSVGLHSYGFTGGMTAGLFGFIAAQTALLSFLGWKNHAQ
jgi:ABC-type transport system involved in cytochrome c biogenesis permease subunit